LSAVSSAVVSTGAGGCAAHPLTSRVPSVSARNLCVMAHIITFPFPLLTVLVERSIVPQSLWRSAHEATVDSIAGCGCHPRRRSQPGVGAKPRRNRARHLWGRAAGGHD